MSEKGNDAWPYHMKRDGSGMVPCDNNPCSLHGGNDVMATSKEDATEKYYDRKYSSNPTGLADGIVGMIMSESSNKNHSPLRGDPGLNPYGTLIEYQDDKMGRVTLMSDRMYGNPGWSVCDDNGTVRIGGMFSQTDIDITKAHRKERTCPRGMEGKNTLYVEGSDVSIYNGESSVDIQIDDASDKDELRNALAAHGWVLDDVDDENSGSSGTHYYMGHIHHEKSSIDSTPFPTGRSLREFGIGGTSQILSKDPRWNKLKADSDDTRSICASALVTMHPQLADSMHWRSSTSSDDITGQRGKKAVMEVDGYKAEFYPRRTGKSKRDAFIRVTDADGTIMDI